MEAVATGEEARDRWETYAPDLLLADFRLPGMDGVDVARAARQWRSSLPIVFMTGGEVAACRGLSSTIAQPGTEHVLKPINIDHLVSLLRRLLAAEADQVAPPIVRATRSTD